MPLKPYEQFAAEPLAFPIGGKIYTPPPIGARTGVILARAIAGDAATLADSSASLWQLVLGCTPECRTRQADGSEGPPCGSAYDDMLADDIPLDALARAGFAMLVDWQGDRAAAERVWESGIDPEARAALAAATRSTIQPSTRRAAASTTRKRASGTGTRKKRAKKAKADQSAGSNSSDDGATSSPTSPASTGSGSTESSTDSPGQSSPI